MAQGKLGEAVADLEAVAGELVTLAIAFDAAQACLDLAQVYLRQARPAEVKRLASQIVAVFRAQRVHREALAAVILFQEAAEQDRVTVELAQKLSSYLRRAQHQPSLRFELDGPDLSGVQRSQISTYELGKQVPRRRTLERLCAAVGVAWEEVQRVLPLFRTLVRAGRRGAGRMALRAEETGRLAEDLFRLVSLRSAVAA